MRAVGTVVGAYPALPAEGMHHVAKALNDSDRDVRSEAVQAIGTLVDASPDLAVDGMRQLE